MIEIIIAAIATIGTSIAGIILAVGKLGPFVNAVNKYMVDRHKRLKDANKSEAAQSPTSQAPISVDGGWSEHLPPTWVAIVCPFVVLIAHAFYFAVTPIMVVSCFVLSTTLIMVFVSEMTLKIIKLIAITARD